MRITDLNVLRMAEAVINTLQMFATKLNLVPKLPQLFEELKALVALHHERNQQLVLGSSDAAVKQEKRKLLETSADELANTMLLFANMENVTEVRGKVDLYYSDLHRVGGDKLLDTCRELHRLATTLLDRLDDYSINTAWLNGFKLTIDGYAAVNSAPRASISARAAIKTEIEKIISDIRALLTDKMDLAFGIVKSREPEFFAAYTNARVIVDRHGKRRPSSPEGETQGMVSGTLTDSVTAEPIADAIVQMEGMPEATTTDEDGSFAFDQVDPGMHSILCIKETYQNLSLTNIEVKADEETEVEGVMVKG